MKPITIIAGTNRDDSLSKTIALYYESLLKHKDVTCRILDLNELPKDYIYSALYDNKGKDSTFNAFQKVIDESEKMVFIIPEYNGSFPGALKVFIDGLRYPDSFENKKAALVGLSAGVQGGALALSHFNDILCYLGMNVLASRVKLARINAHFKNGKITDELYNSLLNIQIEKLIAF